jgi:hypothetical protein
LSSSDDGNDYLINMDVEDQRDINQEIQDDCNVQDFQNRDQNFDEHNNIENVLNDEVCNIAI